MGLIAAKVRQPLLSFAGNLFWMAFWVRKTPLAWALRKFGYFIMALCGQPEARRS